MEQDVAQNLKSLSSEEMSNAVPGGPQLQF